MQICREVAAAVRSWRAHFAATGVSVRDIELLAEQIDRPFLFDQRIAQR
jgi:serine/threonine-protein kinase HipA